MKFRHLLTFAVALATSSFGKTIPNHAIANLVLGQPNFATDDIDPSIYNPFNMDETAAVAIDPLTGKVFVSDEDGDRVLRYANFNTLKNNAGAEAVFGQANFAEQLDNTTQQGLSNPAGLFVDTRGRLWVADSGNNRVVMYEMASFRATFAFADRVFGQSDFVTGTSNTGGITGARMSFPTAVCVDMNDSLWVADAGNNRVLRFDDITDKINGSTADGVLGQALFTTNAAGAGSAGLQTPTGLIVSSAGTLFVSCQNAHRVMRFNNAASLGDGAGASAVLGQPDFVTVSSGSGAAKLSSPGGMDITAADELWVADRSNNRILRFDGASTKPSGSNANGVVGQPDFTTTTTPADPSARDLDLGLGTPCGIAVDSKGALWVPDEDNARVLRFPPDVTKPGLQVNKPPKKVSKKRVKVTGTASDQFGISKVQYKVNNGGVKTANGTTNWSFKAKLKKGKKNKIKIWAVDSVGNKSKTKTVKVRRTKN